MRRRRSRAEYVEAGSALTDLNRTTREERAETYSERRPHTVSESVVDI
jgi:hypothetical protein